MTKAEVMAAALNEFLDVSWDVEAAAVVSPDGLPIASALPPDVEEDRLAAMSASLLTLGERAAQGLNKGALSQVLVEGETGYVALMSAGRNAVLVAVTSHEAKIGLVLFEMRRAAVNIAGALDGKPAENVAQPAFEPAPPEFDVHEDGSSADLQAPSWEASDQEPQSEERVADAASPNWNSTPSVTPGDGEAGQEPSSAESIPQTAIGEEEEEEEESESLPPVKDEAPQLDPAWAAREPSPGESQQEWNAWRSSASQKNPSEDETSADAWTKSGLEEEKDPAHSAPWAQDVSSSSWVQRAEDDSKEPESAAPSGEESDDPAQRVATVWGSDEERAEEEPKTPIEWRTDAEDSEERAAPTSTWT